jgi:hypothetical protein
LALLHLFVNVLPPTCGGNRGNACQVYSNAPRTADSCRRPVASRQVVFDWHEFILDFSPALRHYLAMRSNPEAVQRNRIARYLHLCLQELELDIKQVSKDLDLHVQTLRRLPESAPQLRVLHPLSKYIQSHARARLQARHAA